MNAEQLILAVVCLRIYGINHTQLMISKTHLNTTFICIQCSQLPQALILFGNSAKDISQIYYPSLRFFLNIVILFKNATIANIVFEIGTILRAINF